MHDVGKPRTRRFAENGVVTFHHHDVVGAKLTRKRMQALKFPKDVIEAVATLVELHLRFHGYGSGEWTDSAVRRYVRDAGDQLDRLHVLTRADCTTRNQRKADLLRRTYDDLEARIDTAVGAGGARLDPARPRRQPDHGDPRDRPRTRGGRGLPVPARAAPRPGPDERGRRQGSPAEWAAGRQTASVTRSRQRRTPRARRHRAAARPGSESEVLATPSEPVGVRRHPTPRPALESALGRFARCLLGPPAGRQGERQVAVDRTHARTEMPLIDIRPDRGRRFGGHLGGERGVTGHGGRLGLSAPGRTSRPSCPRRGRLVGPTSLRRPLDAVGPGQARIAMPRLMSSLREGVRPPRTARPWR